MTGLMLFMVGLLALSWNLTGAVSLNVAAIHLGRAAIKAVSPTFPYVLDRSGQSELAQAVTWAERGLQATDEPNRLSCVMLRAHSMAMAWEDARIIAESGVCSDASVPGSSALWSVVEGLRAVERGDPDAASRALRHAIAIASGLLSQSLDPWLGESLSGAAATLPKTTPQFMVGDMVDYEWRTAPKHVSDQWSLVGYSIEESALETGQLVPVSLYWDAQNPVSKVPLNWQQVGALWRQDVRLVNLVPNAGFEWTGQEDVAWNLPISKAQVVETERSGRTTRALRILPDLEGGGAIASTPALPIGSGCRYLVGGWVRSEGAAPTLSIVWDGIANDPNDPPFINLMEGPRDWEWTHISSLVHSKPGASGAMVFAGNWAGVWFQNPHPPRAMMVDNIFLIPLSVPDAPACGLYADAPSRVE